MTTLLTTNTGAVSLMPVDAGSPTPPEGGGSYGRTVVVAVARTVALLRLIDGTSLQASELQHDANGRLLLTTPVGLDVNGSPVVTQATMPALNYLPLTGGTLSGDTTLNAGLVQLKTFSSTATSQKGVYLRTQFNNASANDGTNKIEYATLVEFESQSTNISTYNTGYAVFGSALHASAFAINSINGLRGVGEASAGTANAATGINVLGLASGASTVVFVTGTNSGATVTSSVKATTARPLYSTGNVANTGAGVTNFYGLQVDRPLGTGVIDNLCGVRIEDQSGRTGVGVHYNLCSLGAGSRNYFQGQVGIGTSNPAAGVMLHLVGVQVVDSGDVELSSIGNGVILKSANGTRWRLTVSDAGAPVFTAL